MSRAMHKEPHRRGHRLPLLPTSPLHFRDRPIGCSSSRDRQDTALPEPGHRPLPGPASRLASAWSARHRPASILGGASSAHRRPSYRLVSALSGRRRPPLAGLVGLVVVTLAIAGLTTVTPPSAQAGPPPPPQVTLTLVIEKVQGLDNIDNLSSADFFPKASLAGNPLTDEGEAYGLMISGQKTIYPNWTFSEIVPTTGNPYNVTTTVHFEIWDYDSGWNWGDDSVDITPGPGDAVDLSINVGACLGGSPGSITGSTTGPCDSSIVIEGVDDTRAAVTFRVIMTWPDSDGDGLYDYWEMYGYDADGDGVVDVDLPAMGAKWNHKDLFLELDLVAPVRLDNDDILAMKKAFAAAPIDAGTLASTLAHGRDARPNPDGLPGINLHVDTGRAVSPRASESTELGTCNDGIDNDGDGVIDALEPECSGDGAYLDASDETSSGLSRLNCWV